MLDPASGGGTRVEWTFETEPALPTDRLLEAFGYRRWSRRRARRALKRLQMISRRTAAAAPEPPSAGCE